MNDYQRRIKEECDREDRLENTAVFFMLLAAVGWLLVGLLVYMLLR